MGFFLFGGGGGGCLVVDALIDLMVVFYKLTMSAIEFFINVCAHIYVLDILMLVLAAKCPNVFIVYECYSECFFSLGSNLNLV